MKYFKLFTILLVSVVLFSCSRQSENGNGGKGGGASMQIKGSDTIVNLVQVWAERFSKENPQYNIGVTGGGSGTGFAALLNGTCDIAMASRKIEDKEVTKAKENNINPVEFVVGLDGLAVLVNKNNPVDHLTMEQLRGIFTAQIRNWKEVGGEDRRIVILSRESNSGTHLFFKEHVLRRGDPKGKEEFAPSALLMPSSQAIYDEVSQNPNAIGYTGMGYIYGEVKAISVAKDEKSKNFYPNSDNVISGRYPISRPLFLYTNGTPRGVVKKFMEYVLSPEGQGIVSEMDFVPIKKGK